MYNMKTVNTRDLAHRSKEIRKTLASGERVQWKSRGELIAVLEPARKPGLGAKNNWLRRAAAVGAVNKDVPTASQLIYADRD